MTLHRVVGIDCATLDQKVGLALLECDGTALRLVDARTGHEGTARIVESWMRRGPTLLALDAPLGWPAPLAGHLATHEAGGPVRDLPDELFSRLTDRRIAERTGKRPLEVGADRIARTAVAALKLLAELRARLGAAIPLNWSQGSAPAGHTAIEVYPAGTLRVLGLRDSGYKKAADAAARGEIANELRPRTNLTGDLDPARANADVLDAVVCGIAGVDFLAGRAQAPAADEMAVALREGWIWVRATSSAG